MYLIKGAEVYAPAAIGVKDVLVGGGKILKIGDQLPAAAEYGVEVIDGTGKILTPGFIDGHVHILGGGGEGGPRTRTPEIMLTDITLAGVTTVVGVLGTDGCTRTMSNLLAKAKGLEEEGITTFAYTGSYQVPVRTLTGNVMDDIILLEKVIGTGEIAISDHRSSQPSKRDFLQIVADTRVGGLLSGKAGVVNIHMGSGSARLSLLRNALESTSMLASNMLPTHLNRSKRLLQDGIDYVKIDGGYIDLTTSTGLGPNTKSFRASAALKMVLDAGVPADRVTFSSDGQGSLPRFDADGLMIGLGVGKVMTMYTEFTEAVRTYGIPLETALRPLTSNPATVLKLRDKGHVAENMDADLVLMEKDTLKLDTVIAKGQIMVSHGEAVVKGTFE